MANSETDQPLIAKDPETTDNSPHVVMDTSLGEIVIELDALNALITVKNFLTYVASKHYDKTIFHRVIDGFMIQGGGFSSEGDEKVTDEPIKNEGKMYLIIREEQLLWQGLMIPIAPHNSLSIL